MVPTLSRLLLLPLLLVAACLVPSCAGDAIAYVVDTEAVTGLIASVASLAAVCDPCVPVYIGYPEEMESPMPFPDLLRSCLPPSLNVSFVAIPTVLPLSGEGRRVSAANFGRFSLPELLPEEHEFILYLDADTLVLSSPLTLLADVRTQCSFGPAVIAAASPGQYLQRERGEKTLSQVLSETGRERWRSVRPDADEAGKEPTLNAGVVVMHAPSWRNGPTLGRVRWWLRQGESHDVFAGSGGSQAPLALATAGRVCWLSGAWNTRVGMPCQVLASTDTQPDERSVIVEGKDGSCFRREFVNPDLAHIVHWTTANKPWLPSAESKSPDFSQFWHSRAPTAPCAGSKVLQQAQETRELVALVEQVTSGMHEYTHGLEVRLTSELCDSVVLPPATVGDWPLLAARAAEGDAGSLTELCARPVPRDRVGVVSLAVGPRSCADAMRLALSYDWAHRHGSAFPLYIATTHPSLFAHDSIILPHGARLTVVNISHLLDDPTGADKVSIEGLTAKTQQSRKNRHHMQVMALKTKLFDVLPASLSHLLYVDGDCVVGRPLEPLVRYGALLGGSDKPLVLFPDRGVMGRSNPYHGGVFFMDREASRAFTEEWRVQIESGRHYRDQLAMVAATEATGTRPAFFPSFAGKDTLLAFLDGELLTAWHSGVGVRPCLVHATSWRLTHRTSFGLENERALAGFYASALGVPLASPTSDLLSANATGPVLFSEAYHARLYVWFVTGSLGPAPKPSATDGEEPRITLWTVLSQMEEHRAGAPSFHHK